MQIHHLAISGVSEFTPESHFDQRGLFMEVFRQTHVRDGAHANFEVRQVNLSTSSRGVVRGIHLTRRPSGQSKFVFCANGLVEDAIVDLRPESPTFKSIELIRLSSDVGNAVFLPQGVGHGFKVVSDTATVIYFTDEYYDPDREVVVNPLDPALGIPWREEDGLNLSDRDRGAPTLAQLLTDPLHPLEV